MPENVEYFVAQKGIPWLVEAITAIDEAHDSPSPLLISSILAISRIACVKTHTVELMNNGCVGMLVAQLEKHAQSEPIVNAALEALAEIGNHEAGAEGIMEQKGIDIAIAAFKVCTYACSIIYDISIAL